MLKNIKLSRYEVQRLRERKFDFGGESIIVKTDTPDIIYKFYRESVKDAERENKHRKLELVSERKIDFITNPKSVLTCEGRIIGHAFDYDREDMPLLLAPLSISEKLSYFKRIKEILDYFKRNGIIYGDLKSDNVLINLQTGQIKFCDIDSIQIDSLKTSLKEEYLEGFIKNGMLDERVHIYLHNLMVLDELFADIDSEDTLSSLDMERINRIFNGDCQKIIEYIVKKKGNYKDLFLIDGINEESIVKYKKR